LLVDVVEAVDELEAVVPPAVDPAAAVVSDGLVGLSAHDAAVIAIASSPAARTDRARIHAGR
jgi:hypothetical protein